jgi:PAS domain S-box-containing protein
MAAPVPNLLIAEDEPAHAEAIRRAFLAVGIEGEVRVVDSLGAYRQAVAARLPDIALVDLNLSDGRAMGALTSPPEAGAFPVLVMTSYGNEQTAVDVLKMGALDYVVKSPATFADMPRIVERALREWGLLQARKRAEAALRESEERFRKVFEEGPLGMALASLADNRILEINETFCKMLGYTAEELKRLTFADFTHPDYRARDEEAIRRMREGQIHKHYAEKQYLKKNGEVIWGSRALARIGSPGSKSFCTLVMVQDITEHKQADERLRESEQRYRELIESAPEAIFIQSQGRFVYLNPAMLRLMGADKPEELLDADFIERVAPPYREIVHERIRLQRETGKPAPLIDLEYVRLDGSRIPVESTAVAVRHQGSEAHLVFVRDITDRKKSEERVAAYQRRLRVLGSKLAVAEEEERRRIAADLHDEVVQLLVVAKIKLETLAANKSAVQVAPEVLEIHELISQSLRETRTLLFDLSPVILYELGFEPAVESLLEPVRKDGGLATSFRTDDLPKPMTRDVSGVLFRAVREALHNVVKHARARSVSVSVRREGESVLVEVRDDGMGFDVEKILSPQNMGGGFGLFDVRERLDYLGGSLTVRSEPGKGTTLVLCVPLAQGESRTEK